MYDQSLTLELIPWIGEITSLPLVIKGVLRGEDAARAAAYPNVRGIVVSNHGGRQLDGAIAPLTALPDVVRHIDRVNEQRAATSSAPSCEVYVDGGVRRGRDIFKARALGARAVMIGRPLIWGLAVGGTPGVTKVIDILKEELKTCMQLGGCQDMDQIDSTFIVKRSEA